METRNASRPPSPYLFTTERRTPMTAAGFRKQLAVIGVAAALPYPFHPHMLRHACGFALANDRHDTRAIQEWLGHRNIRHTNNRMVTVVHPDARSLEKLAGVDACRGAHHRHQIALAAGLDPQHAKAALGVVEGPPLHQTTEGLALNPRSSSGYDEDGVARWNLPSVLPTKTDVPPFSTGSA